MPSSNRKMQVEMSENNYDDRSLLGAHLNRSRDSPSEETVMMVPQNVAATTSNV